jgi:hypothetical protein
MDVTLQKMNDDKSFSDLLTVTVGDFESTDITLTTDGIYVIKIVKGMTTEYYTLPSFCILESCLLANLNKVLCNKIDSTNCNTEDHYNFNALLIMSHSFFLLLSKEMNYNYIYSSINSDKIEELYTLKTFIDRFDEYCGNSETPCVPCNT